jgi:hypothetical protein
MSRLPPCLFVVALAACKGPPEAPQELDELCAYLYAHQNDEEPEAMIDGIANMSAWLDENSEAVAEGYTVQNLDQASLDALDDRERDAAKIVGGAIASTSPMSLDAMLEALITADQAEVFPETYISFERVFDEDPACFMSHECDRLEFDNDTLADLPLVGELASTSTSQDLWVDFEHGPALMHRSWMHERSTASVLAIEQQYNIAVTIPRADDTAWRLQAVWADVEVIGADIPASTMLNMLIDGMGDNDQTLYAYVEANSQ